MLTISLYPYTPTLYALSLLFIKDINVNKSERSHLWNGTRVKNKNNPNEIVAEREVHTKNINGNNW